MKHHSGTLERERLAVPVGQRDHIQGPITGPLTLVEYGDYECSFCRTAHPVVKALQQSFSDRLSFVFRNFPLTHVHPHADHAAEAAEAAAAQQRFWEMHDTLLENQDALEDEDLAEYAVALRLDSGRVLDEILSGAHEGRIREDFMSGVRSGVNGTPTFFINDVRYDGSFDYQSLFSALVEAGEE